MLQPSHAEALGLSPEPGESRFAKVFRTEPRGPMNPLVLQEEELRQLAHELTILSPELATQLAEHAGWGE